ncbi:MAG TPA: EscU/YscU/HrcU family type III secretion system export apparatus switch protein [Candidatus Baltobacteraceae bacterium]|jgi:flagellar biosynthesis protein FlhB|nr:EscU/YscU/HrcU family type III secretion system export apparatus switch protein [Candidatus Baltobacteraceae bacterium]
MSDESEKPFEATAQRLEKARREGNVARCSELGANAAFLAAGSALVASAPFLGALEFRAIARSASGRVEAFDSIAIVALALLPIAAAALAGSAVAVAQNGGGIFLFPAPKLERLNPVEGCKRMFSRETLAHGLRALAAFALATCAMAPALRAAAAQAITAGSVQGVAAGIWSAAQRVAAAACLVGAAFAVAEYAAARRTWLRKLRMSFDDRKREAKEQEGDPIERGRRRALHRSLLRGSVADVAKASFVVANPTHVVVALRYDPPAVPVPTILVRAADDAAARARALAAGYGIPVVENVPLARALYRDGRVGNPIDRTHFVAVAEVVAALSGAGLLRS